MHLCAPFGFLATIASTLDATQCAETCAVNGFTAAALTSNPTPEAYCYCGDVVASGASPASSTLCSLPCPGNKSQNCGALGFSAVYAPATCAGPLPPKPIGPPLPWGRACSQSAVRNLPFCDTSLPRSTRVDDLVARFSLPELASQLQARSSAAVPRLGLGPFMFGNNNIHGLAGEHCHETGRCPVSFPDGIAMAASFNETAWRRMGAIAGREMRALYNVAAANSSNPGIGLTSWGPTCNLIRDGRWGRSQESASECPFHSGRYCAAISMGLQDSEDSRYLLVASGLKHFAAYSLEQYLNVERQTFNAAVTRFDATDSYFPAFRTAIVEGGAAGVMYAANEFQLWDPLVDPTPSPISGGVPGCLSLYLSHLLTSWNFSGYRCTDGGQIGQAVALHKYVPTLD